MRTKILVIVIIFLLLAIAKKSKAMGATKPNILEPQANKYQLLTQQVIRVDAKGNGNYNAQRTNHIHQGIDLVVQPNETVFAPFNGRIARQANPYSGDPNYTGIEIINDAGDTKIKIFYVKNFKVGKQIKQGEPMAQAQNIALKYGAPMMPHIHIEVRKNNTIINPTNLFI